MLKRIFFIFYFVSILLFLSAQDPLFEVKNDAGISIFSVTNSGVKIFGMGLEAEGDNIWISDTAGTPLLSVNGFGVSVQNSSGIQLLSAGPLGMRVSNAMGDSLMIARSDFVRFYLNPLADESRGGFAIGSVGSREMSNFLDLTPQNYFIGHNAGLANTLGQYNTFIGYNSGSSNTTGSNNVFMGYEAGMSNTEGLQNVFIGYQSGAANIGVGSYTGDYNVFIGYLSGKNNSDGQSNVYIGDMCGFNNTEGRYNVFLGKNTGVQNRLGNFNVYLGSQSGASNQNGSYNTFVGYLTAYNDTVSNNTFIGYRSAYNHISGENNTFLGNYSGWHNTTGAQNTFVGDHAGDGNYTGSGNVFLGYRAGQPETGSNKLYVENSFSSSPLIYGDFSTNIVVINGNSSHNSNNRTLFVNGTAGGSTAWYNDSDERLKEKITPIEHALDKVCDLQGVTFEWKDKINREEDTQIGFVAQDVEEILPEVVANENDHYSMQYAPITALLVEAVKEQQKMIKALQKEIEELKNKK